MKQVIESLHWNEAKTMAIDIELIPPSEIHTEKLAHAILMFPHGQEIAQLKLIGDKVLLHL